MPIPFHVRVLGRLTSVALLLCLVAGPVATTSCDDSSGPDLCSLVSLSSNGSVQIDMDCTSGISATISNIQYDQFGRRTSYNFDIQCSGGGSDHYTGSVSGIAYNQYGQALSATVRINGQTCSVNA